jgi:hypothetical protein
MTTAGHAILVALGNPLLGRNAIVLISIEFAIQKEIADIVASLTSPFLLRKYGLKENGALLVTENEQSLLPM